jgi:hypothetical protein
MTTLRNASLFEDIYAVLVREACGSSSQHLEQADFVHRCVSWSQEDPYRTREYRFQGSLGSGGKFWLTPESFHVNTYPEEITAARAEIIRRTNAALAKLFVEPEACPKDR